MASNPAQPYVPPPGTYNPGFDLSSLIGGDAAKQFTGNAAWAPSGDNNPAQVQSGLNVFKNSFKNLVGRDPTQDEMAGYANNALYGAWNQAGNLGYSDLSNLSNNYIQNAFGPDIASHQQDAQTTQLGKSQSTIQDLVNSITKNTASNLADPNSSTYKAFSGSMNNMGISPSSGAFQAGAGSTLSNTASNAINAALETVGLPAIAQTQNMGNMPLSFAQQNSDLSHINSIGDFSLQQGINQKLFNDMQPSGFEKAMGMANMVGSTASNIAGPGMATASLTSYVCMELIKRGLISESDMDDFHVHIMPAMFQKGRAFYKYAMDGYKLVQAVNRVGLDWKPYKTLLFDRVMEEKDPCKAVDLYAEACCALCLHSDASLWEPKVFRTSFLDSLPFLPRLFAYKPFREALAKCLRIKTLFLYDKPKCEVHHGA